MTKKRTSLRAIFVATFRQWMYDKPLRQGAVIAFFAIFSGPALLVLVFNFAGLFIEKKKITNEVTQQIEASISPGAAEQLAEAVNKAGEMDGGAVSTVVSIAIILFAATRVFVHLQETLNGIWEVRRKKKNPLRMMLGMLFPVALILSIGFLLLVSMAASTILSSAGSWLVQYVRREILYLFHALDVLLSLGVTAVLFALIFKFLPDAKVKWKSVFPGAIITSLLFLVLKYALSFYFAKAEPASVYGTAGSVVLIMLWTAASSMALLFGAEFTRQYADHHHLEAGPKNHAVKKPRRRVGDDEHDEKN